MFERYLHLRSELAQRELGIVWTPYERVLEESAAWAVRAVARKRPAWPGADVTA